MKNLNEYVIERLKINKDISPIKYKYHPKDFDELRSLVKQLLDERGPDADLNDIDTSKINSFYDKNKFIGLFENLDPHNIKIDKWKVGHIISMRYMFTRCQNFNCDLSNWKVENVSTMEEMFRGCKKFTGEGLENWKPIKCKSMDDMFDDCTSLKNKPSWYEK